MSRGFYVFACALWVFFALFPSSSMLGNYVTYFQWAVAVAFALMALKPKDA